ncbi:MAG: MBL fold metallo-hydrolase [Oscillospiraceae bacterium]|nr:MBL fold metallo-hydrolase [Oscillospiraceae bacterium]
MKITFLHHSAFLVELPDCTLLFDWTGEPLPAFDRTLPLYVFASHHHNDHYTPAIFRLGMEGVTYILASCIRLSARRRAEYAIDDAHVIRLSAGKTAEIGDLTVTTIRSTDAGVAFLVKAGDKTLFHAGDLNWWHWEGEDPAWNDKMARDFAASCDRLRGVRADAAFLPLDPRQEDAFWWGFHRFMTTLDAGTAFPMHCWGDFSVIPRLKALPESAPYRDRVADITGDGESFLL